MKSITSVILIIAGVVLFVLFTNPKLQELKSIQMEVKSLELANENAKTLNTKMNTLLDVKNKISPQDLEKIHKMLPNNVENVKLIIDFDKMLDAMIIERGTGNIYKNLNTNKDPSAKVSIENPKVTQGGIVDTSYDSSKLGVVTFSFVVSLTYGDFLEFLRRIEYSTRILDIESISFSAPVDQQSGQSRNDPVYTFNVSLKTYWLKYITDK